MLQTFALPTEGAKLNVTKLVFYIVDVFAMEKYAGNQLAVFRNTSTLSSLEMQKIAKEMHFSETTFILSEKKRNHGYDVRTFSPEKEMPFAGHPTVGTAYVIQQEIIKKPVAEVILNLKVGQIPVVFSYRDKQPDRLFMKQMAPKFDQTFDADTAAAVLGLNEKDIDERFPIEEVSTGVPFIIMPLKTLNAVKKARTNKDKYFKLIEKTEAKAILIFSPETYNAENDLNVRVFADYYGVPEDPATGSANGCLAGYLVKNRYFGKEKIAIKVEQGCEIGRPSLLFLNAECTDGKIGVYVGGRVFMVAKGEFL
jgi:trans-2,3-dihydro-3-hydroxyanthranilate isomerase